MTETHMFTPAADTSLAFRDDASGRRYAAGIVVPWGIRMLNTDTGEWEQFTEGAFDEFFERGSAEDLDIYFRMRHKSDPSSHIVGRAVKAENRPEGQWVEFRMATDDKSLDVWRQLNDRTLRRLSVEFLNLDPTVAVNDDPHQPQGLVTRAAMLGTAVVERPFYPDATVTSTRSLVDGVANIEPDGAIVPPKPTRAFSALRSWSDTTRQRYLP